MKSVKSIKETEKKKDTTNAQDRKKKLQDYEKAIEAKKKEFEQDLKNGLAKYGMPQDLFENTGMNDREVVILLKGKIDGIKVAMRAIESHDK